MLGPDAERGGPGSAALKRSGSATSKPRGAEPRAAVRPHDLAGEQVHRRRAEEIGDEGVDRIGIDVHRRSDLHDFARAHDHDAVGERHRLLLVVGHEDEGALERLVQPVAFGAQLAPQLGIEARERLVEQEGRGLRDQRARQRHPLRLAARALARHLVEQMRDVHHLGDLAHALRPLLGRHALHAQPELDVLPHRLVREQGMGLEHHAEPAVARLEVVDHAPVDADLARARVLEAGDHAQGRGLAAARRTHQHDELAILDGQADVAHRDHAAERLAQADELDAGHGYLRTMPKLKPRARCRRMIRPTMMSGMVMPTESAAWRP